MKRVAKAARVGFAVSACVLASSLSRDVVAQQSPSFAGKTIAVIVGTTTGGSTDMSARMMAPFIAKYLSGTPGAVVQNKPGANGMTAMNMFAQQIAPDGLTIIVASNSQIDPINYRVPQSHYDPSAFGIVGGIGLGGSTILIRNEALPRLTDKGAPPVVMATISGMPRSGMQIAAWGAEYLGWNIKWITGYRGNPELELAFERGEVDMTSFANAVLKPGMFDKSKFTPLYQTGTNAGNVAAAIPALAGVPLLTDTMKGKFADPIAENAFQYWRYISSINNWVALPPKTPGDIVEAYRNAFRKVIADPEFLAQTAKIGDEVSVIPPENMEAVIKTLAELPPEALGHMKRMLIRQGLNLEDGK